MRIHHVWKLSVVCIIALACLSGMTGCTPGGSSGSGSGGGGGGTGVQPLLVSLEATDGICPNNNGTFPPFNNIYNNTSPTNPLPVPNADPSCDIASEPLKLLDNLELYLAINTANAGINLYQWEITAGGGGFSTNLTNFAQTVGNTITYFTPRMTDLYALNDLDHGVQNITISSTAFTADRLFTGGFFNLTFFWPDATQVSASAGGSGISHANPTHVADYYHIQADGAVTIVAVSETNAAVTVLTNIVLHLYNSNLQQTYVAGANASGYSRINADLSANADPLRLGALSYYVEVEQPTNNAPYYLLLAADQTAPNPATTVQKILQIPSPWNGRTYVGRVTELDSFAQSPPRDSTSTNKPPPLVYANDYCYTNADYYIVTGAGIATITPTFARPSYCPTYIFGCNTPTGAVAGIVRVYSNAVPQPLPVSPLPNTQNQFGLGAGRIYYVEVASFPTRTDQWGHPLGTTYTITADNSTMVPTVSPFPPLAASPCAPPGP